MNNLARVLPFLGCVIGMPLMMVVMMSGKRSTDTTPGPDDIAKLRVEVDQLRSELSERDDATR